MTGKTPKPVGDCEPHRLGKPVYIDDGLGVHSIANASKMPAVSVHLYAGPIPRCRTYNEATRVFDWVELSYFTIHGEEVRASSVLVAAKR